MNQFIYILLISPILIPGSVRRLGDGTLRRGSAVRAGAARRSQVCVHSARAADSLHSALAVLPRGEHSVPGAEHHAY